MLFPIRQEYWDCLCLLGDRSHLKPMLFLPSRLAHVSWLSMFLLTSQRRRVPSGERCAFAIPNPLLLLMPCNSQTNYCSICASPARPLQAVLKAPRSPASAIHTPALLQTLLIRNTTHRSKAPLTARHHSLKLSKCGRKGKIWEKRGVKVDSEKVYKGGGPSSCRRTRSCWLMKALAVMASQCDNAGTLKAPTLLLHLLQSSWEQSGHYPTVFCYGAPCGSESAQLSSPPGLRLTGVLAGVSFPSRSPILLED